jgi:ubiquinone/menaquinone biosynthesis C-methylase UbiE
MEMRHREGGRGHPQKNGPAGHETRPTSYRMHDPEIVFCALGLKNGDVFLDLGCGTGDYSFRAAGEVGNEGVVYAADVRADLLDSLAERAEACGLNNIRIVAADIRDPLPFRDAEIDVCLISTVLHVPDVWKVCGDIFPEVRRVIKTGGRLAVIECKKEEMPFGPPLSMRISPSELESRVLLYGFENAGLVDLGFNYLMIFG